MKFLENDLIVLDEEVEGANEAIEASGKILSEKGVIEETYIQAMKDAYAKNGPYFVLAPHIAIPHARPEDGVNEASVSLVRLKEPVVFGHEMNDPVQLVFCLGASSNEEHLMLLRKLTTLLNSQDNINVLLEGNKDSINNMIEEMER